MVDLFLRLVEEKSFVRRPLKQLLAAGYKYVVSVYFISYFQAVEKPELNK
jgi:hypothetical protein